MLGVRKQDKGHREVSGRTYIHGEIDFFDKVPKLGPRLVPSNRNPRNKTVLVLWYSRLLRRESLGSQLQGAVKMVFLVLGSRMAQLAVFVAGLGCKIASS